MLSTISFMTKLAETDTEADWEVSSPINDAASRASTFLAEISPSSMLVDDRVGRWPCGLAIASEGMPSS